MKKHCISKLSFTCPCWGGALASDVRHCRFACRISLPGRVLHTREWKVWLDRWQKNSFRRKTFSHKSQMRWLDFLSIRSFAARKSLEHFLLPETFWQWFPEAQYSPIHFHYQSHVYGFSVGLIWSELDEDWVVITLGEFPCGMCLLVVWDFTAHCIAEQTTIKRKRPAVRLTLVNHLHGQFLQCETKTAAKDSKIPFAKHRSIIAQESYMHVSVRIHNGFSFSRRFSHTSPAYWLLFLIWSGGWMFCDSLVTKTSNNAIDKQHNCPQPSKKTEAASWYLMNMLDSKVTWKARNWLRTNTELFFYSRCWFLFTSEILSSIF